MHCTYPWRGERGEEGDRGYYFALITLRNYYARSYFVSLNHNCNWVTIYWKKKKKTVCAWCAAVKLLKWIKKSTSARNRVKLKRVGKNKNIQKNFFKNAGDPT